MAAVEAPEFDLLDHQLFAEREPWDVFEWLQREAPVEADGGREALDEGIHRFGEPARPDLLVAFALGRHGVGTD